MTLSKTLQEALGASKVVAAPAARGPLELLALAHWQRHGMRLDLFDRLVKAFEAVPSGCLGAVLEEAFYDKREPVECVVERFRTMHDEDLVREIEQAASRVRFPRVKGPRP